MIHCLCLKPRAWPWHARVQVHSLYAHRKCWPLALPLARSFLAYRFLHVCSVRERVIHSYTSTSYNSKYLPGRGEEGGLPRAPKVWILTALTLSTAPGAGEELFIYDPQCHHVQPRSNFLIGVNKVKKNRNQKRNQKMLLTCLYTCSIKCDFTFQHDCVNSIGICE